MRKTIYFLATCLLAIGCSTISNDKINGNGDVQSETKDVDPFKEVNSSGDFVLTLVQDSAWLVDITGESNLVALLDIETKGTTLEIKPKKGYSFKQNHHIEITIHHNGIQGYNHSGAGSIDLGDLNTSLLTVDVSGTVFIAGNIIAEIASLTISGSGTIDATIETDEVGVDISGSGNCTFDGKSTSGSFYVSGTGDIQAPQLELSSAEIRVSGVADMRLNVSDKIDAKISGVGHVEYYGDASTNINISGSGYVRKIN